MDEKQSEPANQPVTDANTSGADAAAGWVNSTTVNTENTPAEQFGDSSDQQIAWTASEFMDHDKSASWYIMLAVTAVVAAAAFYALFRDVITAIVILVAGAALGLFARRKPRQLNYLLDSSGLSIGAKHLPYGTFRSFAVVDEGSFSSIVLLPLKRFGLLITIYFDPQDEDRIVDLIGKHLPFEPHNPDAVDRLMSRIRF